MSEIGTFVFCFLKRSQSQNQRDKTMEMTVLAYGCLKSDVHIDLKGLNKIQTTFFLSRSNMYTQPGLGGRGKSSEGLLSSQK